MFLTGHVNEQNINVETLHKPKLEKSTPAGVKADPFSIFDVLDETDKKGESFVATVHMHPWEGIENVQSSSVDYNTQSEYEQVGYSVVGIVFSKDGHFRFYTYKQPFDVKIKIYGDLVELINKKKSVFKLSLI